MLYDISGSHQFGSSTEWQNLCKWKDSNGKEATAQKELRMCSKRLPTPLEQARDLQMDIAGLRQALTLMPECSFSERQTSAFVAQKFKSWGFDVKSIADSTSLVARVGSGKSVAIFATMDALRVSSTPGNDEETVLMHACGHDGNMACVMSACRILARRLRGSNSGALEVIMQSGGESSGESDEPRKIVGSGALESSMMIMGLHVDCTIRSGHAHIVRPPQFEQSCAEAVELLDASARDILGESRVRIVSRPTYMHNFESYLNLIPGSMIYLGVGIPGNVHSHHSPEFRINDSALHLGTAILTEAALRLLKAEPRQLS